MAEETSARPLTPSKLEKFIGVGISSFLLGTGTGMFASMLVGKEYVLIAGPLVGTSVALISAHYTNKLIELWYE